MTTTWGHTLQWICGGQAVVLGDHDLQHPHWCPVCDRRREPGCDVEYRDAHHRYGETHFSALYT